MSFQFQAPNDNVKRRGGLKARRSMCIGPHFKFGSYFLHTFIVYRKILCFIVFFIIKEQKMSYFDKSN